MKFQNIKALLNSNDNDQIISALTILSKNPCVEFHEELLTIYDKKLTLSITSYAGRAIKQVEKLKKKLSEIESVSYFNEEFLVLSKDKKLKILKAILLNKIHISMPIEKVLKFYFMETNGKVVYMFAEVFATKLPAQVMPLLEEKLIDCGKYYKEKILIILAFMKSTKHIDTVIEEFGITSYEPMLIAGARSIWNISPLIVIARVRQLIESKKIPLKMIASEICKLLNFTELRGIIEFLMLDKNKIVQDNAIDAYQMLKHDTKSDIDTIIPRSVEEFEHLKEILENSSKVQEKITVIKILDNLGNCDFLETIIKNLSNEADPFLISSYLKYIGKYGELKYIDIISPYLLHSDDRIISNCIEGLEHCLSPLAGDLVLPFLDSSNHRVSANAAVVLWKLGLKKSVTAYLDKAVLSKNLWKRKAVINALSRINSKELVSYLDRFDEEKNPDIIEKVKQIKEKLNILSTSNELMDFIVETGKIPEQMINKKIEEILAPDLDVFCKVRAAKILGYMVSRDHLNSIIALFRNFEIHFSVRIELLKIITMIGEKSVEYLVNAVHDCNSSITSFALENLLNIDCSEWVDDLMPLLFDEDRDVVAKAAVLLNKYAAEDVISIVHELILSTEVEARRSGLKIIDLIGSRKLFEFAVFLKNDLHAEISVRSNSIVSRLCAENGYVISTGNKKSESAIAEKRVLTPLEVLNSLSEITKPSIIEKRFRLMEPHLTKKHLPTILSVAETTTNVILLSKISLLLGRFHSEPDVRDLIRRLIEDSNEQVSTNTIESLIQSKNAVLVDSLMKCLASSETGVQMATLELFMSNTIYGRIFFKMIQEGDKRILPLKKIIDMALQPEKDEKSE